MPSSKSQSFFETVSGKAVDALWVLRTIPIAALISVLLALFIFKSGGQHDFCVGITAGLLLGLTVQTFAIRSVEVNQGPQRSDVDNMSVTRS